MKTETAVDRLGKIKAQIADLEDQEDRLRAILINSGVDTVEGKLFRATVSYSQYNRVDYPGLIEALNPPKRIVAKFTKEDHRVTVRVVSR